MKYVISGYYGFNNSGDDALLLSIIKGIKEKDEKAKITVLSKSPKITEKAYGVEAVYRYNIFSLLTKIATCNVLISGGGTLIQDATSTKSLMYYLTVIKLALFFRKKVMLYANGIGPLTSLVNEEKTKEVLNKVKLITLRDENSYIDLTRMGVSKPKIEVTADPAFLLSSDGDGRKLLNSYDVDENKKLMCVSVREWKGNPDNFADVMAEFCDYAAAQYNIYTIFLPMQASVDYGIANTIKSKMQNDATVIGGKYSIGTILSMMSEMHLCVGMRLHTLIYSVNSVVPTIGLVYDPKVSGFMDYIKENRYLNVSDISVEELKRLLDDLMFNYESIKSEMKLNTMNLQEKSKRNNELLFEMINGGKR